MSINSLYVSKVFNVSGGLKTTEIRECRVEKGSTNRYVGHFTRLWSVGFEFRERVWKFYGNYRNYGYGYGSPEKLTEVRGTSTSIVKVLVRRATGKRLINRLPNLSLITRAPPAEQRGPWFSYGTVHVLMIDAICNGRGPLGYR